jgi:hypothetical protein
MPSGGGSMLLVVEAACARWWRTCPDDGGPYSPESIRAPPASTLPSLARRSNSGGQIWQHAVGSRWCAWCVARSDGRRPDLDAGAAAGGLIWRRAA